jgi:hypothetical protein
MKLHYLRKKLVLLPLASLILLAAGFWVALVRSDISGLIVYNETGQPIEALRLAACGQSATFRKVAEEDSVRLKFGPEGDPGEFEIESIGAPGFKWKGGYIQPRGGYVVMARLWADGTVEVHTQISIWQRLFGNGSVVNE